MAGLSRFMMIRSRTKHRKLSRVRWEKTYAGWWFGTFFIFHNIWDNPSHWLIFFRGVETTNQYEFPADSFIWKINLVCLRNINVWARPLDWNSQQRIWKLLQKDYGWVARNLSDLIRGLAEPHINWGVPSWKWVKSFFGIIWVWSPTVFSQEAKNLGGKLSSWTGSLILGMECPCCNILGIAVQLDPSSPGWGNTRLLVQTRSTKLVIKRASGAESSCFNFIHSQPASWKPPSKGWLYPKIVSVFFPDILGVAIFMF